MILVSRLAPNFIANAVLADGSIAEEFNFKSYVNGNLVVLFFWPLDFTYVCPSEIIAFNNRYLEFKKRHVKIVGVSVDSEYSHRIWRSLPINNGGIGKIRFPLVSDLKKEIIRLYGVEHFNMKVALRASFFIDNNFIVRHQVINDLSFGRNIDEIIRIIDAFLFNKNSGKVCPAQWKIGDEGISSSSDSVSRFLSKNYDKI